MVDKKYIIIGIATVAILGGIYYYREDMMNLIDYTSTKQEIKDYTKKKIKKSPINIKIENLNEL